MVVWLTTEADNQSSQLCVKGSEVVTELFSDVRNRQHISYHIMHVMS